VYRASEFKTRFEHFETRLTQIQTDLILREVSGLSDAQAEVVASQVSLAEAERRDLAALSEEMRAENARLVEHVSACSSAEIAATLRAASGQTKKALSALSAQAEAQKAQLEALRLSGVVDAASLRDKLDAISVASAAALGSTEASAAMAAAATERLAVQHAEASEELKALLEASATKTGEDASILQRRLAAMRKTQEEMLKTQKDLASSVAEARTAQMAALREAQRSTSGEVAASAAAVLDNLGGLKQLHETELSLLGDVVKSTAAIKKTMDSIDAKTSRIDANVDSLLAQMAQLLSAQSNAAASDPQKRKDAVLASLRSLRSSMAACDESMQRVYRANPGAAVQGALKAVQRCVQLVASASLSLEEKTRMLPPAQSPRVEAAKLLSSLQPCAGVSCNTSAEVIADLLAPLRCALGMLADANAEADAALSGAGSNAAAKVPLGWARDLWSFAFTAFAFSGTLTSLVAAKSGGYSGAACDEARFAQFVMQKQQDAALGGSSAVDVFEWAAMAAAPGDPVTTALKPSVGPANGLEAQRLLDRLAAFANANKADESFKIFVDMVPPSGAPSSLTRGMATQAVSSSYKAKIGDAVNLKVQATQDCFFYLIEQDSVGGLCPLVPNVSVASVDNRLLANVPRAVPSPGDGFTIVFTPPAGLERVIAFGLKQPMAEWGQLAAVANDAQRGAALVRGMATAATAPAASVASFTLAFDLFE
jgi:hypothetical protein